MWGKGGHCPVCPPAGTDGETRATRKTWGKAVPGQLYTFSGEGWRLLYRLRWKIEVSYYEQKTFWNLCRYMLRSTRGIGMLVNTISLAYSAMKLLPYTNAGFAEYQGQSVQDFRFALSEAIREQLIFTTFAKSLKNREKHTTVISLLKQKALGVTNVV